MAMTDTNQTRSDPGLPVTRAAALRQYARNQGATGFLGLAFSPCRTCDARRIAERVAQLAAGAQRVGSLVGPQARYEVFTRRDSLRPLRLLIGEGADGRRQVLAADRRPPASPPPRYLAELELLELEEELKAMDARLDWEPTALDAPSNDAKYAGRHHLLYIPLSTRGTPLKVGETAQLMRDRYPRDRVARGKGGVAAKYWVARVLVEDTRRGHRGEWIPAQKHQMQDVEFLVARRLSRGGATLPLHATRKRGAKVLPLSATGTVKVGSPLPGPLTTRFPDNPTEPGVVSGRARNNIALTAGDSYELPALRSALCSCGCRPHLANDLKNAGRQ
jgi:hypothetical protein